MRTNFAGLFTVILASQWQVHASAAEPPAGQTMLQKGMAVAKALNAENIARGSIVRIIGLRTGTNEVPQAKQDCVKTADVSFANDLYAAALSKAFTAQELDQVIAFMNSPTGRLHPTKLAALLATLTKLRASESLTKEDEAHIVALSKFAPVYRKLESAPHLTPQLKQDMTARFEPIIFACMGGPAR